MLNYHPAESLEKDTCVFCGDDDIVYVDALVLQGDHCYPYMLCRDCARLPGITAVVEGVLATVVRRGDRLKERLLEPVALPLHAHCEPQTRHVPLTAEDLSFSP
jgi:hypothetical protein